MGWHDSDVSTFLPQQLDHNNHNHNNHHESNHDCDWRDRECMAAAHEASCTNACTGVPRNSPGLCCLQLLIS